MAAPAHGGRTAGAVQRLLAGRRADSAVEPLRRRRVVGRRGEVRGPGGGHALRDLVRCRLGTSGPARGLPAGLTTATRRAAVTDAHASVVIQRLASPAGPRCPARRAPPGRWPDRPGARPAVRLARIEGVADRTCPDSAGAWLASQDLGWGAAGYYWTASAGSAMQFISHPSPGAVDPLANVAAGSRLAVRYVRHL